MKPTLEPSRVPADWDVVAPRPERTQGYFAVQAALATAAGTVRVYLGVVQERGLLLRAFHAVNVGTTLGVSATIYHTFRPFISTVKDGVATVRYLGNGRGTNAYALQANVPFRLHDEERFNERLPVGALVGVDVVTTSTPAATTVLLQAAYANPGG